MADIEARLRRLLKVNTAVLGHLHVRSVLARVASSALELSGAAHAVVHVDDSEPIEAGDGGPGPDAVEVPLTVGGEPFATLVVSRHPSGAFTHDDIELLHALASAADVALEKARTYEATRQRERTAHERIAELVAEATPTTIPDAATLGLYEDLSPRERDVLLLIADGLSNRQIAERLFLSEKTVKNHVTTLLRKMGMERRTQAAVYVAQLRDA